MRHVHPCGAEISPGDALCPRCFNPLVWAGDRLEGDAQAATTRSAVDREGSAILVPCTCGRSHPVGAPQPCVFGGRPDRSSSTPAGAAPSLSLPGGLRVPLEARPLLLGRLSEDERIGEALDDDYVSRRHATVRFDGATVWLADAGSTHGTWVDHRRIDAEEPLPSGETTVVLGTRVAVTVNVP